MSIKNVQLFYEKMQQDESLKAQIKQWLVQANEQYTNHVVQLANESGYAIDKVDMYQLTNEATNQSLGDGELDDTTLEEVAGGVVWVPVAILAGVAGAVSVAAVGGIVVGSIVKVTTQ